MPLGTEEIPRLGELLRVLCSCLEREMPSLPLDPHAPASEMRPHIRALLGNLQLLGDILDITPRPVVLQVGTLAGWLAGCKGCNELLHIGATLGCERQGCRSAGPHR